MTLEAIIAGLINDVEKLKAGSIGSSDTIDQITGFSIVAMASIAMSSGGANVFSVAPALAPVMSVTGQNTGTFLVGTALVGFSDCG